VLLQRRGPIPLQIDSVPYPGLRADVGHALGLARETYTFAVTPRRRSQSVGVLAHSISTSRFTAADGARHPQAPSARHPDGANDAGDLERLQQATTPAMELASEGGGCAARPDLTLQGAPPTAGTRAPARRAYQEPGNGQVEDHSQRGRSSMVAFNRRHFWRTNFLRVATTPNVDHAGVILPTLPIQVSNTTRSILPLPVP
jgi:hypothetical protein